MILFHLLIIYGFLAYVSVAIFIYHNTGWSNEWDSTELKMYMLAPLTVIMLLGFALKTTLGAECRPAWPYVMAGLLVWLALMFFIYFLIPGT